MSGDTTTPNMGLVKPEVGASASTWGTKWNSNADLTDNLFAFSTSEVNALWAAISTLQSQIAAIAAGEQQESIGTVKWWPGNVWFPPGFEVCDGHWLPVAGFPVLASLIGYSWGGDGGANFALPDLRGLVLVGLDDGSGRLAGQYGGDAFGTVGGNAVVTLSALQAPPHQHGGGTDIEGYHVHNVPTPTPSAAGPGGYPINIGPVGYQGALTDNQGGHVHNILTDVQGGGAPHTNVQPGTLGYWIIKANLL